MFSEHSNRTQGLKAPLFEVNIKTIAKRKGKLFCSCLAIHSHLSLVTQKAKNLPAMWETQARSLGREDSLAEGMATPSSILPWRSPWTEEPGGLQSKGSQRTRHSWVTNTFTFLLDCTQAVKGRGSPIWKLLDSLWGHCWFYCNSRLPEAY